MMNQFPASFLWGASSSAFQIEGGWDEGGKGMTVASSRASMQSFCTTVSADTPVGENSMRTPRAGRLGRSLEILPAPSNTITAS